MSKLEWFVEIVRLARLACENQGDDVVVMSSYSGDNDRMLAYSDDVVMIYYQKDKGDLSVIDPNREEFYYLSLTNGDIAEINPDMKVLDHLRKKFILDALVG